MQGSTGGIPNTVEATKGTVPTRATNKKESVLHTKLLLNDGLLSPILRSIVHSTSCFVILFVAVPKLRGVLIDLQMRFFFSFCSR